LRIAHYFEALRLEKGGTVRAVVDMCAVLAARGHRVTMLTHDTRDAPEAWLAGGDDQPALTRLARPSRPGRFYSGRQLREIAPHLKDFDALHLHGIWTPSTAQMARLAHGRGVPFIVSTHGMLDVWSMAQRTMKKRLYLLLIGNRMLRHAALFHTTAEEERRQAARWIDAARARIVPCICDLEAFADLPGPDLAHRQFEITDGGGPTVLFLSRVHYKKSPEILIRAAALLRDRGSPCRLLFAGTGERAYMASLRSLADGLNLGDACRFLGMVTGAAKLSLYQAADVFALPTSQENFGLVYTEALACGTPVVATKGTDIWRDLERSGGAVIADRAPEAFADAIAGLAADPQRRAEMGRRGRAFIFDWLNPDKIGAGFEALYAEASGTADPV
jgi:glycosyltransferase involved in cell wall biosynthesis